MSDHLYTPKQAVQINATRIERIFQKYEQVGFLYPAKKKLLRPHFRQIIKNWKALSVSGEQLLWVFSATDPGTTQHFASITLWKQSNFGLFAQHLVSTGNPYLSLRVMLEAQAIGEQQYTADQIRSSQNWFRPDNRYAYRVFASMFDKLGAEKAALIRHQYLHLPLEAIRILEDVHFRAETVEGIDPEFIDFVKHQYGSVFVTAEELDQEDIQLQRHGELFKKYGLQLSRKVWKIRNHQTGEICACLVANRAPIGLNFSFLENRAYYILDVSLDEQERAALLPLMHSLLQPLYQDIPIGCIPIVTDAASSAVLVQKGARPVREYMQSIWLREGFRQWYEHIESFLKRIERK